MREKKLKIINKEQNLPPLPEVLSKIEQKVYYPDTCISDVSSLIYTESAMPGNLFACHEQVFFAR
jgi:HD-like signal output (HDOD) protein